MILIRPRGIKEPSQLTIAFHDCFLAANDNSACLTVQ